MPKLLGPKAHSLTALVRDQDDQDEDYAPPEYGISTNQIDESELRPHYYGVNFLRPLPVEEEPEEGEDDMEVSIYSHHYFREFG